MAFLFLTVICVLVTRAQAIQTEDELWKNCTTSTTHYVLQVPGSLIPVTDPGVTGCTYHSPDGEFNVEAVEQNDNQPLDCICQRSGLWLKPLWFRYALAPSTSTVISMCG